MKLSQYNFFVEQMQKVIMYNAIHDNFFVVKQDEYVKINKLLNNLDIFKDEFPSFYNKLINMGFIIDDEVNEIDIIRYNNNKVIYLDRKYWVTINPTLQCNLKCWYCSVDYAKTKFNNKMMSKDIINRIKKHLTLKVKSKDINALHLDWFGGEPLMYFEEVIVPISKHAVTLAEKYNIPLTQHITTNASLVNEKMIKKFKKNRINSFQITLDGDEVSHNKIKNEKGEPTYKTIINSVIRINEIIKNSIITLRINYDKNTLKNINSIISDLEISEKQRVRIDLQKVWQAKLDVKNNEDYDNAVLELKKHGFPVLNWAFRPQRYHSCYSDRYYHIAINYDGKLYKCTARDYSNEVGILEKNGVIKYDEIKMARYFNKATFENKTCLECKLLPLCFGPCIQKNIETTDIESICLYNNSEYTVEKYLINRINESY
jgi:uncharacterized protein